MKNNVLITILTPTYNRSEKLICLYDSLVRQSFFNFRWLIIDDGSDDQTDKTVSTFDSSLFEIIYIYQNNSGKHKAINYAIKYIDSELVFVVDSDDYLTSDAIETVTLDWAKVSSDTIGISYLRKFPNGKIIGNNFSNNNIVSTYSLERIVKNNIGDKAEVWKTQEFKRVQFLEFDNERFFSEQHKYLIMSGPGMMLFINKPIYVCQYLRDGLSSRIKSLQYENPLGTIANAVILSMRIYPISTRIKAFLKVYAYSRISGLKFIKIFRSCDFGIFWLILFPLGIYYEYYLKIQYKFYN